jgi:hypothetical protein
MKQIDVLEFLQLKIDFSLDMMKKAIKNRDMVSNSGYWDYQIDSLTIDIAGYKMALEQIKLLQAERETSDKATGQLLSLFVPDIFP